MSEGEKDYLGWKLSEKVAFLVADTRKWRVAQARYGRLHRSKEDKSSLDIHIEQLRYP